MISYEEAQAAKNDPHMRQQYIDQIDLEWAKPFIARVRYSSQRLQNNYMSTHKSLRTILDIPGAQSLVTVYPAAFHIYETEADFKSALIDHEGYHAKNNFEIPKGVVTTRRMICGVLIYGDQYHERMRCYGEIRALLSQLRAYRNGLRNVSDHHLQELLTSLRRHRNICSDAKHDVILRDEL